MLLKNLFKSRDIVSPIPVGVYLTLEYDKKGALHKIYQGLKAESFVSDELNHAIRESSIVPQSIHLKGNKSYVSGVLYTAKHYLADGLLPDCVEDQMIADFIISPNGFKFIAGMIRTEEQTSVGTALMAQTLKMAGFIILPYLLITEPITDAHLEKIITATSFPYGYPMIAGYFIFRNGDVIIESANIAQYSVSSSKKNAITTKYTSKGELRAVFALSNKKKLDCSYSDLVRFNIHPNSVVVVEEGSTKIIHSFMFEEDLAPARPNKISCPTCGRLISVPVSGATICSDTHCPSRIYPNISHFLNTLQMPSITFAQYEAMRISDPNIKTIEDVIETPMYTSVEVKTSLKKFVMAMIPELSDDECLRLVDLCNTSADTLVYYMENPSKFRGDLNVSGIWVNKFMKWCSDTKNVDQFVSLMHNKHIKIESGYKSFEGSPMFRNRKIAITGTFKHGSLSDISDILQSYSAEVTTHYEHDISLVLVGSIAENVSGVLLNKAKQNGIHVMDEDEFFEKYKIDEDLQAFF